MEAYREASSELEAQRKAEQTPRARKTVKWAPSELEDERHARQKLEAAESMEKASQTFDAGSACEEVGRSSSSSGVYRVTTEDASGAQSEVTYRQGDNIMVYSKAAGGWKDDGMVYLV